MNPQPSTVAADADRQDLQRWALGISYNGQGYEGWQSQPSGRTVQDQLETALSQFAAEPVATVCAGRTDAARCAGSCPS